MLSAMRPLLGMFPMPATTSAPVMEPAPEQASRVVNVVGPPWNTSLAKTGRKVIIGSASAVMQKASTISPCHGALVPDEGDALPHAGEHGLAWSCCGMNFNERR